MARILATDGLDSGCVEILLEKGHHVDMMHFERNELLEGAISGYDVIIIRSATKLDSEVLMANTSRKSRIHLIVRAGVGLDNIDLEKASELGILVKNTPTASTKAVVEFTIGHLLTGVRNISKADRAMRSSEWAKKSSRGTELSGKNLGLVGYGRISKGVAEVARLLGMNVHIFDPFLDEDSVKNSDVVIHDSVKSLFSSCTHISIHCALTESTRGMVDYDLIRLMPDVSPDGIVCGRHIVNCARGGILNESDVYRMLDSGHIRSLGIDVFENEPEGNPVLSSHPNVTSTPHIGAATAEAQKRIGAEIVDLILSEFDS
ncbi:MAG TPA: 3-phosphoglycerate dehydrogenase [Candidatus Thalassarchaeaceae archaeon]|nr:MAG TPA: 3-phosphoglycerate dehydrogenase [Candidatus Poseidoniales archaeon]HII89544.1 3-phosphoglycerate dehydrogenase [Candidatus Thalassarchaeaceae archaeon]